MTGPHYSVVTLNATDRDAGENARVTYSMLLVDGFYINSQTGGCHYSRNVQLFTGFCDTAFISDYNISVVLIT